MFIILDFSPSKLYSSTLKRGPIPKGFIGNQERREYKPSQIVRDVP